MNDLLVPFYVAHHVPAYLAALLTFIGYLLLGGLGGLVWHFLKGARK